MRHAVVQFLQAALSPRKQVFTRSICPKRAVELRPRNPSIRRGSGTATGRASPRGPPSGAHCGVARGRLASLKLKGRVLLAALRPVARGPQSLHATQAATARKAARKEAPTGQPGAAGADRANWVASEVFAAFRAEAARKPARKERGSPTPQRRAGVPRAASGGGRQTLARDSVEMPGNSPVSGGPPEADHGPQEPREARQGPAALGERGPAPAPPETFTKTAPSLSLGMP